MQAHRNTLQTLFQVHGRLLVPLYQRPYVWGKPEWDLLWGAIDWTAERQLADDKARPYFLGAMVLDQLPVPAGQIPARQIIDGQQRLVTLQLCLAAIRDLCADPALLDYHDLLRQMTVNDGPKVAPEARFKVWPTNIDRDVFARAMTAGSLVAVKSLRQEQPAERHRFLDAYIFFEGKVRAWLSRGDLAERMAALWGTLTQLLVIVTIDLDREDDAQQIFETLNALGMRLLPVDLVKNHLLRSAEADGLDTVALYSSYWQPIDANDAFWREPERQGRLTRPRVDNFLQHYLTLKTKSEVLSSHLFGAFREWSKGAPLSVVDHLKLIARYSTLYRSWSAPNPHAGFFDSLRRLDTTTLLPLVLELFAQLGTGDEELAETLRVLESYLVRRMVCGLTTKNYNKLVVSWLQKLEGEPLSCDRVLAALLEEEGESARWPADNEFEYRWCTEPLYKKQKPARIRMLLEGCEKALHSTKTEKIHFVEALTIEHIMPQQWRDHWPIPQGPDSAEARHRDVMLHTIGNLTLLTQPLNSEVSNGSWADRRPEVQKFSLLKLNQGWPDSWDELQIEERARQLFAVAREVWPRPKTAKDDQLWQPPTSTLGGAGQEWKLGETILAYELLRSSKAFPGSTEIRKLGELLGRSPGAVGYKLHNLRSAETQGGVGLPHRSHVDDEVVAKFRGDLEGLRVAAGKVRYELGEGRSDAPS